VSEAKDLSIEDCALVLSKIQCAAPPYPQPFAMTTWII